MDRGRCDARRGARACVRAFVRRGGECRGRGRTPRQHVVRDVYRRVVTRRERGGLAGLLAGGRGIRRVAFRLVAASRCVDGIKLNKMESIT